MSAHHAPPPAPSILTLPPDVWLHIFTHLAPSSSLPTLSSLSLTCKRMLSLIDTLGWPHFLTALYPWISLDATEHGYSQYVNHRRPKRLRQRSRGWYAARYAKGLESAWNKVVLIPSAVDIPNVAQKEKQAGAGRRRRRVHFAIPTLCVGTRYLIVGVRSELLLYPAHTTKKGALGQIVARIKLRANESDQDGTSSGKKYHDNPWQDITSLRKLNDEATNLVVGFADGTLQLIDLLDGSDRVRAQVVHSTGGGGKQEIADISTSDNLIASLSKRGELRLHRLPPSPADELESWSWTIDSDGTATPSQAGSEEEAEEDAAVASRPVFRSAGFNNAALDASTTGSGTRAWSVLLNPNWVAVGLTGEHAVHIYPLSSSGVEVELGEACKVASTGQRTSAYALATPPAHSPLPSFLLFVGFYDGIVRVYDLRQMDEEELNMQNLTLNGSRKRHVRRELDVVALFKAEFDPDAIYSISFAGPRATLLVVGSARHAKVRVFDVGVLVGYDVPLLSAPVGKDEEIEEEEKDWTAFAIANTDSPQYAVVGAADRIVGVTDRKLWCFNFSTPLLTPSKGEENKVAYFRHTSGTLCYSHPHPHTITE